MLYIWRINVVYKWIHVVYINGLMVYNIGLKDEINMNFTLLQHANRLPNKYISTVFQTIFFKITNTLESALSRKRPLNTLH